MASSASHQHELDRLAGTDPEFFEFLAKDAPELLAYEPGAKPGKAQLKKKPRAAAASSASAGDSEADEDDDEAVGDGGKDDASEDDEESDGASEDSSDDDDAVDAADADASGEAKSSGRTGKVLTASAVEAMARTAVGDSDPRAIRELIHAMRAAAAMSEAGAGRSEKEATGLKYVITSAAVYHRVLVAGMRRLPGLLLAAAGVGEGAARKARAGKRQRAADADADSDADSDAEAGPLRVAEASRFSRHRTAIRASLSAVLRLIPGLRSRSLAVFALRCLRAWIPLFEPFPKHARALIKALLSQWSVSDDAGVQLVAFLRLRQCCLALPAALGADRVLKGLYVGFLRATRTLGAPSSAAVARQGNDAAARLALMGNCVVETAGLFPALTYRHAFVYVRQLAVHLRAALTSPTSSNRDKVLRWQFVSAVRLWGAVLRAHAGTGAADPATNPLADLVFPVTQVAIGVIRLAPGPAWHPLRLHLVETLVELQWATGSFVPCSRTLLEAVSFAVTGRGAADALAADGPRKHKPATAEATRFADSLPSVLRVPGTFLTSPPVREALLDRSLTLLAEWLRAGHTSPAFPEVAGPVLAQLRSLAKLATSRRAGAVLSGGVGGRWKARIRAVITSNEARAAVVASLRASSSLKPSDASAVASFMASERKAAAQAFAGEKQKEADDVGKAAKRAAMEAAAAGPSEDSAAEDRRAVEAAVGVAPDEEDGDDDEADRVEDLDLDDFE